MVNAGILRKIDSWKINFGKQKKIFNQKKKKNLKQKKKKQLSIMQETYMYCDIRYET